MKKPFEEPSIEIQKFQIADVITTSGLEENETDLDIGG